jgi:hypothetical protein
VNLSRITLLTGRARVTSASMTSPCVGGLPRQPERKGSDHSVSKDESSISDEEWKRFLQEAEATLPDAPKEPSARARMVTERLRNQPTPTEGWRTFETSRPRPRPRRRSGWYLVGVVVAVALAVVAVNPSWVVDRFAGGDSRGPVTVESKRPGQPPATEAAGELPTLEEPFRGSPAAQWADGRDGIHLPTARATGWMKRAEVARALELSRDFLAESSMDPGVLNGQRPSRAIELINPHQQDVQEYLKSAFRTASRENDPLRLFSRFDSAKVRLVGDVVRTRGRMTFREGERGALEVTADVTFVYPVVRTAEGSDEVARTIVRREIVMSWDDPAKVITEPGTFSLVSYNTSTTNGGCDNYTGYLIPSFSAERATQAPGGGTEVDPYDRSESLDKRMRETGDSGCDTATRT